MSKVLTGSHIDFFTGIVTKSYNGPDTGDQIIIGDDYVLGAGLFSEYLKHNKQCKFVKSKAMDGRVVFTDVFRAIIITDQYNVARYPIYTKQDINNTTKLF